MFDYRLTSNKFLEKEINDSVHMSVCCKVRNSLMCFTLTIEQRPVGVNLSKNLRSLFPHTKRLFILHT